ncbi:MAG TPA: hypothetical protein P5136_02660 [Methanofastidiosum sp.]|nr:hypothetical protein [Methanofastidiosum sp.]
MNKRYERFSEIALKKDNERKMLVTLGVFITIIAICYVIEKLLNTSFVSNIVMGVSFILIVLYVKYLLTRRSSVKQLNTISFQKNALEQMINYYKEQIEFLSSKDSDKLDPQYRQDKLEELNKVLAEAEELYARKTEEREKQLLETLGDD